MQESDGDCEEMVGWWVHLCKVVDIMPKVKVYVVYVYHMGIISPHTIKYLRRILQETLDFDIAHFLPLSAMSPMYNRSAEI